MVIYRELNTNTTRLKKLTPVDRITETPNSTPLSEELYWKNYKTVASFT
ncbi:hypothetical protein AALB_2743 [Agarivorans albus MKT 106]|uniref:Uncharacterized protein n=1 Tax=Agarivorans albus MKT 106 TaxID=1331007 RepID=R9PN09_AGAAL|nr:hypothetical protein AALB_2743 [Agarivorans albus MKT 106]